MVKFGKRLEEELIKDGWEDHYIQYKKLKKVISAVSKDEVAGEMVQAFVKKEQFVVKLTDSVDAASTHYTESAARALKLAELACEATTTLLGAATKPTPADALSTHIEGADVLDSLISARFELEDLREFALVNREGVRKILKKWHKKVSTCSEEMSEQVDSVLTGTPLATSDETAHKVSNAMAMLSDMEAKVALKSTAHAAYLKAAITTARNTRSPRPSSSVASSGRASGRRASGLGLALAAADGAAAGVDDVAFTLDGSEAREWRAEPAMRSPGCPAVKSHRGGMTARSAPSTSHYTRLGCSCSCAASSCSWLCPSAYPSSACSVSTRPSSLPLPMVLMTLQTRLVPASAQKRSRSSMRSSLGLPRRRSAR